MLFGYDIVPSLNTMMDYLCIPGRSLATTRVCGIISSQSPQVGLSLYAGAIFGALLVYLDFLSRRGSVVLAVVVFVVGVSMQTIPTDLPLFFVGRTFTGWGIGMWYSLIPGHLSDYFLSLVAFLDGCFYMPCIVDKTTLK